MATLHQHTAAPAPATLPAAAEARSGPRTFGTAERSLVRRLHTLLPAQSLLDVLNDRLVADQGERVPRYTMEQLHAELRAVAVPVEGPADWAGLRRLLAKARTDGTLARITAGLIDDFAVLFQLSPAQVMRAKDVLLSARDETDEEASA
ncbi:MAG TPA: hypothetical protein VFA75_19505 [Nevskia sp.]|nr:hypothetical protein [Nevskia sp.]